jgi:aminoglycoside phosphotransferase (APT) family kinase protein
MLRDRPPPQALVWATRSVGIDAQLHAVRALAGGVSAAMHLLAVRRFDGRLERYVLRRFVRADWLAAEPDLASGEARVLDLLVSSAVPAPRLVAVDPDGQAAGHPAVLMTALPGRIDWHPADRGSWLAGLVAVLPAIHAVKVPAGAAVPQYRPYDRGVAMAVPAWSRHPAAWRRAIEVYQGPLPACDQTFIHRDFHPGNVLWRRGRVSGVVDWVVASIGCPDADAGHCRANLAQYADQATAEDFLRRYQSVTGRRDYHPYWDIAIIDSIGPADEPAPAIDEFVARAVARL